MTRTAVTSLYLHKYLGEKEDQNWRWPNVMANNIVDDYKLLIWTYFYAAKRYQYVAFSMHMLCPNFSNVASLHTI